MEKNKQSSSLRSHTGIPGYFSEICFTIIIETNIVQVGLCTSGLFDEMKLKIGIQIIL